MLNKDNAAIARKLKLACASFQREVDAILKEIEHVNNLSYCSLPEIEACIQAVSRTHRVTAQDIMGRARNAETAWARQVAIYLAATTTKYRYERIAQCFAKSRSNINHAVETVKNRISVDKKAKEGVEKALGELSK